MHISKVKLAGGDYKRLVDHMERKHDFYKSDVDVAKSKDNIILKPYIRDLKGFIKSQGVKRVRKDSVGALNCVCTVADGDKMYLEQDPKRYERWGWAVINSTLKSLNLTREDLLGAVIHLDEDRSGNVKGGNAHIQFSLAPLVRKDGKVILSAKQVTNRNAFKILHDNLQAKMKQQGFKGVYVNPNVSDRGLGKETLLEYKKAQETNKQLEKNLSELQEKLSDISDTVIQLTLEKEQLENNIRSIKKDSEELKKLKKYILRFGNGVEVLKRFEQSQKETSIDR